MRFNASFATLQHFDHALSDRGFRVPAHQGLQIDSQTRVKVFQLLECGFPDGFVVVAQLEQQRLRLPGGEPERL